MLSSGKLSLNTNCPSRLSLQARLTNGRRKVAGVASVTSPTTFLMANVADPSQVSSSPPTPRKPDDWHGFRRPVLCDPAVFLSSLLLVLPLSQTCVYESTFLSVPFQSVAVYHPAWQRGSKFVLLTLNSWVTNLLPTSRNQLRMKRLRGDDLLLGRW